MTVTLNTKLISSLVAAASGSGSGPVSSDISFATAIPLTSGSIAYMPAQTVGSVLAFTVAASPVKNSVVYVRLTADGTNAPTFTGMNPLAGSYYDNRNGVVNIVQFLYDGYDTWYYCTQADNATATTAATAITLTGPTSGVVSTASTNFTVGSNGTLAASTVVTPSSTDAGDVFTPTSVTLTGTATATFTVTPSSTTGNRTISVTNDQGLTNPTSITYNATAAATVPGAPTIGTATAGVTSASVAFTAPASDGGSAITGYTVTSTPGSITGTGTTSPITVSGLTAGTAYTFTVHATNAVGNSTESAASNSVTPTTGTDWPRLNNLSTTTFESGTGPYTYTGGGTALSTEKGGLTTKKLPSGVDGYLEFIITDAVDSVEVGFRNVQSTNVYNSQLSGFYTTAGTGAVPGAYRHISGSNLATTPQAGDTIRVGRVGSLWKTWVMASGSGTWTEIDSWSTNITTADIWFDVVCASTSAVQLNAWSGFV